MLQSGKIGMDLWLVGMPLLFHLCWEVSTILPRSSTCVPKEWADHAYALNDLGYVLYSRTRSIVIPVLLSGAILLLFDRNLGTSFYLSDIYVAGKIPNEGGSHSVQQHLFWFLVTLKFISFCCLQWVWHRRYYQWTAANRSSVIWRWWDLCLLAYWPLSFGRTTCL